MPYDILYDNIKYDIIEMLAIPVSRSKFLPIYR